MPYDSLEPRATGLMFFDILDSGFKNPSLPSGSRAEKQSVIERCVKLRAAADRLGCPVFYTRPNHRPDGRDAIWLYTDTDKELRLRGDPEKERLGHTVGRRPGVLGGDIVDELKPNGGDTIISKNRWSAFYQTNLNLHLRTSGIDSIILTGGSSKSGIASTAFAARDHDIHLVIVRDAVTAARAHDGGTREDFDWIMERLFPRLARVRTTDEVIDMLERGAQSE